MNEKRGTTSLFRRSGLPPGLLEEERGTVAVIAAITQPVLVGAMGLGAETGYWYLKQQKLQHAADVAAHAAAVRYRAGDLKRALETTASRIATASGHAPGSLALGSETGAGGSRKGRSS